MNRIRVIALAAMVGLACTGELTAQFPVTQGTVPFAFGVNGSVLPAGDYIAAPLSANLIKIRSVDGRGSALVAVISGQTQSVSGPSEWMFKRYGDQYFLHEIVKPGDSNAFIPASKQEKLAGIKLAQGNGSQTVQIAVKLVR